MIATSGKHSYKMCVKSTTRKDKLITKNEERNVTNANCNSLYMLVTMTISVSDNKRQYMKELWKRDKYPVFSFNFHAVHIGLISIWLWVIMTSHLLRKVSDNNRELRFGVSGKRKTTGRYLHLVKPRGKYSYTDIPLLSVFDLTCSRFHVKNEFKPKKVWRVFQNFRATFAASELSAKLKSL